jgi:predicted AAA+ superfamily ATPase
MIIPRKLKNTILASLKKHPVVGILGSRQVGKTTLAKTVKELKHKDAVYLDLELPSDWNKLQDPELYLNQFVNSLVIIDEIQRMPTLFPILRALVDQKRTVGRFLILGSASPDLIRQASESLAGRIIYHELTPLNFLETGQEGVQTLWLRGGYPNSLLAENDQDSFVWREAFIKTYLEMDLPQLGIRIPSIQLRRFWTMLAHSHGQLWNAQKIANSLGISAPTARHYLDLLEETFMVRQLLPFYANVKKRLIKSPKVYIRDSGLLHTLLHIGVIDDLQGHPSLGSSWEGFVIEQIFSLMPENRETYFYRTNAGAEIDLIILDKKNSPIAIEIKYSLSPGLSRGFWTAFKELSCHRGYVIYPGNESYPIGKNILVLPIEELSNIIQK